MVSERLDTKSRGYMFLQSVNQIIIEEVALGFFRKLES